MLPKAVPDEVYEEGQQRRDKDNKVGDDEADDLRQEDKDLLHATKADKNGDSNDNDDETESEDDSDLEALMRENSDYSSSSSSQNEGDSISETGESTKGKAGKLKQRSRNRSTYETPVNTIAVLVVASWLMRVPVMYRDFNK